MANNYGLNTFNAQSELGQGLQNIALAMFGRGGGKQQGSDDIARAGLYNEQANDLVQKRMAQEKMLDEQKKNRVLANSQFLTAKTGMSADALEALNSSDEYGNLYDSMQHLLDPTVKLQRSAAMSALASVMMDDPTKTTAGFGNADNIEKAYDTALGSAIKTEALSNKLTPEQLSNYNIASGKMPHAMSGSTGQVANKITGRVTNEENPLYNSIVNKNNEAADSAERKSKAAVTASKALENQRNKKTNEPPKAAAPKSTLTFIGYDADGNPLYRVVANTIGATITKPKTGKQPKQPKQPQNKAPKPTSTKKGTTVSAW